MEPVVEGLETFARKPFLVEAVEITADNINELAVHIGTLREKEDGTPYIQVDRRLIPNVFRVYPGFWLTRMDGQFRCYAPSVFRQQFVSMSGEIASLVEFINATP